MVSFTEVLAINDQKKIMACPKSYAAVEFGTLSWGTMLLRIPFDESLKQKIDTFIWIPLKCENFKNF